MSAPSFSFAWVERALGGELRRAERRCPQVFSYECLLSDSRAVGPGSAFVALAGEKFDGHDFVAGAVAAGASAVFVTREEVARGLGCDVFVVQDTLRAYRRLSAEWRAAFSIPVVAIAGAVGKTTTKELLAAALSAHYPNVLKTEGSENGFVGIPKTLLRLRPGHSAAVIEIGIDAVGAMAEHLEIVRPTASLVTAIAEEHLEFLKDLETVAREESIALTWVGDRGGGVAINAEDPWLVPWAAKAWPGRVRYGWSGGKSALDFAGNYDAKHDTLVVREAGGASETYPCPLPGKHNASNLLAAVALARALDAEPDAIREGLQNFAAPKARSKWVSGRDARGVLEILGDYYNASPASMRAALGLFKERASAPTGAKIAVLADMRELGDRELAYHAELVEPIVAAGVGQVYLFGKCMGALRDALGKEKRIAVYYYAPTDDQMATLVEDLGRALDARSGAASLVIKGSRGMRLERVFDVVEKRISVK